MEIVHGIDIVEITKFAQLLHDSRSDFAERCFTNRERLSNSANRLAGWYAAKEAVSKALAIGWTNNIAWTDIEIEHEAEGRPVVLLHGKAAEIATNLGIKKWTVSISHSESYAVASAIGVSTSNT